MSVLLAESDHDLLTEDGDAILLDGVVAVPSSTIAATSIGALGSGVTSRDSWGLVSAWMDALASQPADVRELADWPATLDPQQTPQAALRWLAQWKGERLNEDQPVADQRDQIEQAAGTEFGQPNRFVAAARRHLTGDRNVTLDERTDGNGGADPWWVRVTTIDSETPDAAAVVSALRRAKPAGIQIAHRTTPGWLWSDVVNAYATWQATLDAHADWEDLVTEPPP